MFRKHEWLDLGLKDCLQFYRDTEMTAKTEKERWYVRRYLAQNDLFYLMVDVLKRHDMIREWLFARCREVQAEPNGYLDLWAREHYKSTIITFGLTIFDIINNPEVTVGIFSHTRDIATQFLRQIMQELETNADLKYLFPEIFWEHPKRQAPKWSEGDGIIVKRKGNPKESTIEAWGLVDGMPTSKHFTRRIYDDVVTQRSVGTPEMIKKTTVAWELSNNLGAKGGYERYAGTRYHLYDSYQEMIRREAVKVRVYPATSDGTDDCTKAVLMDPEYLAEKRKKQGPHTFSCQMLQNPNADKTQGFREEWLEYWPCLSWANLTIIFLVDPASKLKATSDYTTMWVIGLGGDGNYYIIDIIRDRLSLTGRCKNLMALHRKYKPVFVGYEEYGQQADIEHILYVQEQENYRFTITPMGGQLRKEHRILRLVPIFEQRRIYLPTSLIRHDYEGKAVDLIRVFKEEEYSIYPVVSHDDMLDALARLEDEEVKLIPRPTPKPENWNALQAARKAMRAQRPVV